MTNRNHSPTLLRDIFSVSCYSLLSGLGGAMLLGVVVLMMAPGAQADTLETKLQKLPQISLDEVRRGSLMLKLASGGVSVDAPMLKTDVQMDISGMVARVAVHQRFHNPGAEWVEGVYVFPLPEKAAVDRMRLRIGQRVIEGEIQEKRQARESYEKAKRAGKKASLLSQQRPNIFTTSVANIGPGEVVEVEIEYQQDLRYEQGRFAIRFPMVVAPRYIPGRPVDGVEVRQFSGSGWARDTDQVKDASEITPPVLDSSGGEMNKVAIKINLAAGFPLSRLESTYHAIDSMRDEMGVHRIHLSKGGAVADRDFELTWTPMAGSEPHAALFNESWAGNDYSLLMVMPPSATGAISRQPREMVLVVDTSGSMHGTSMQQAKAALKMALRRLAPGDRFNLIQFNSITHALFSGAVAANRGNLARALEYVDGLEADGGTEIAPALNRALRGAERGSLLRQVVFLTDGSVGNEEALFGIIQQRLGASRLFTVGIGSAPNSYFMNRAAQFGRGSFTYIGKISEVRQKMEALFAKLESPVLTDLAVDFEDGNKRVEMWPARLPDLYLGEPVVLAIKAGEETDGITLHGKLDGKPWQQKLILQGGAQRPGVHLLWARRKIAHLMDQRARGRGEEQVREAVLEVALEHRLVSQYTSLVAVDKTPSKPEDEALRRKNVPTQLPRGWSANKVFGSMPQTATAAPMNLMLGVLTLLAAWLLARCGGYRKRESA